jgi:hypothetical protein
MNWGSGESLKVSTRCGFNPNARQILLTADWLIPVAVAIDRVDQCVASTGVSSRVFTITSSTASSVTERGAPGRGSSWSPSRRPARNRDLHFAAVDCLIPSSLATTVLFLPVADNRTMRQRRASAWALFGRRAHRSRVERSSSVNSRGSRIGLGIAPPIVAYNDKNAHHETQIPNYPIISDSDH